MNVIIVGAGKVGLTLAETLRNEDHNVSIIDPDPEVVEYVSNEYDILGIEGSGIVCKDLLSAGADGADLVIATAPDDELNILSCVIAKRLGARHGIARVRDPEHSGQQVFLRDELGISLIVNPELYAASEISRIIRMPSAIKVDTFAKGRIDLAELKIGDGDRLDGLTLRELPSVYKSKILVCAIARGEEVYIPSGDFVLKGGDRIYVTASHEALSHFAKEQSGAAQKIKNVFIIGGGKISYYLAKNLLDAGYNSVKIFEIDRERSVALGKLLPKAKIICADGTDQDVLIEEGLDAADVCVSLTGIDEENIIISMFAKSRGCKKVITKVNKESLNKMAESVGIDSLISPKRLTANMIIQYARAIENTGGSNIQTLYKLVDNKVEAIEFIANNSSKILGVPLKDLELKKDILLAGIIRGSRVIIPSGNDQIEAMDRVIIVTTNRYFQDLDEIIK